MWVLMLWHITSNMLILLYSKVLLALPAPRWSNVFSSPWRELIGQQEILFDIMDFIFCDWSEVPYSVVLRIYILRTTACKTSNIFRARARSQCYPNLPAHPNSLDSLQTSSLMYYLLVLFYADSDISRRRVHQLLHPSAGFTVYYLLSSLSTITFFFLPGIAWESFLRSAHIKFDWQILVRNGAGITMFYNRLPIYVLHFWRPYAIYFFNPSAQVISLISIAILGYPISFHGMKELKKV